MTDVMNQSLISLDEEEEKGGVFAVSQNFGIMLRHYRVKVKDMTLKELAEASQLSESYINRLERGEKVRPSVPTVLRLADALDIPHSVLMATTFQSVENNAPMTLADVLIQNNYVINERTLSKEAKALLVKINEYIVQCDWSPRSKVKDLYTLSEMVDEFKEAI
ncbi:MULTISPECIES: helix-turn-helix domain-containing protein [Paenibacillaceae]|uniref:helix-turn-helix domain-containing protein n=1 Tax=Paenibacillaceae TaxID=186822 RepID=UPI00054FF3DB|nr:MULTISPECIES: helix-turn-helix transcriptional regulator [Brevibacillus]MCM3472193.1 helix-turn-helix domain-containing protein [Brevibacillus borstelensis]QHZ58433.1 helix-turn-helix domain-containing protein [Brevibacillus sp. NSP2.1]